MLIVVYVKNTIFFIALWIISSFVCARKDRVCVDYPYLFHGKLFKTICARELSHRVLRSLAIFYRLYRIWTISKTTTIHNAKCEIRLIFCRISRTILTLQHFRISKLLTSWKTNKISAQMTVRLWATIDQHSYRKSRKKNFHYPFNWTLFAIKNIWMWLEYNTS